MRKAASKANDTRNAILRVALWLSLSSTFTALAADSDEMTRRQRAEAGLRSGMVLDSSTADLAADLLPPEVLRHYERNEYRNTVVDWPVGSGDPNPSSWQEATESNSRALEVTDLGTIIEKRTGQQPAYVYGTPFPNIDPNDGHAAIKIVWNYFYNEIYRNGNTYNDVTLYWINAAGVDRELTTRVHFKYYDGVPAEFRSENPLNLNQQSKSEVTSPADLYGTASLSWRYRDPDKQDQVWAYVPALRRVRAVSPANRSDGFLGSDMSLDDGPFFDGKPEAFKWTLLGKRDALVPVDPYRLNGSGRAIPLGGGGGYRWIAQDVPVFGFQDGTWKGVAWAPIALKLARRESWIVEGSPKESYYLFGRIQLTIDAEVWTGSWSRKFDWKGQCLAVLARESGPLRLGPDGKYVFVSGPGNGVSTDTVTNVSFNRATLTSIRPDNRSENMVPYEPSFFDFQALHRLGK